MVKIESKRRNRIAFSLFTAMYVCLTAYLIYLYIDTSVKEITITFAAYLPLLSFYFYAFYAHIYRYRFRLLLDEESFSFERFYRKKKVFYGDITEIVKFNILYRDGIHELLKIRLKNGRKIQFCIDQLTIQEKWDIKYYLEQKSGLCICEKKGFI